MERSFMAVKYRKDLKLIVHPYLFVLKEGKKIQENYLDYSLLMLLVVSPEVLDPLLLKTPPFPLLRIWIMSLWRKNPQL